MNKRLLIGFLAMIPVISVQAADKASSSLAKIENFNFATDPLKSFPVERAFTDRLKSKGLGQAFNSVLLLAKLQNAPIDKEIRSAIDECKDDFYRGVLKKELVLKKIKEDQILLNDDQGHNELSIFIARNCSQADIDSLIQRASYEITSEFPFLEDIEQNGKQAHDLKSQAKFDHLQHLQLILKLESRIRKQKRLNWYREYTKSERIRRVREEQARIEAQRLEIVRQVQEAARLELQRREEERLEAQRREDAYNNRNFILRFIGDLFPPR